MNNVSTGLKEELKEEIVHYLRENNFTLTWDPGIMLKIPRMIACHFLRIVEGYRTITHKRGGTAGTNNW